MNIDTYYAYQELRALCSDLLAAPPPPARRQIEAALTRHLQAHCLRCGAMLSQQQRLDPREDLCYPCEVELIPRPPDDHDVSRDGDVPF